MLKIMINKIFDYLFNKNKMTKIVSSEKDALNSSEKYISDIKNFIHSLLKQEIKETIYITFIGDSITSGAYATKFDENFANLVRQMINKQQKKGYFYEAISTFDNTRMQHQDDLVYSDTCKIGINGPTKASLLMNIGDKVTFSRNISELKIYFCQNSNAGSLEIYRNNILIDCLNCIGQEDINVNLQVKNIRTGKADWEIKCTNAPVEITLVKTHSKPSIKNPIGFYRFAKGGSIIEDFTSDPVLDAIGLKERQIFFITLSTNNILYGKSIKESKENFINLINGLKLRNDKHRLIVCVPPKPGPNAYMPAGNENLESIFSNYKRMIQDLANELCIGIIDFSILDLYGLGYYAQDQIHPNSLGHRLMAKLICQKLDIPFREDLRFKFFKK